MDKNMNTLEAADARKMIKSAERFIRLTSGPAFPLHGQAPCIENPDTGELVALCPSQGMTLLDYYAIHAPDSVIADFFDRNGWDGHKFENQAEVRYRFAEAMIAERNKRLAQLKPEA
jgi:hypothetical protein